MAIMNKKQKDFVKIYISLIVIGLLAVNWNTVSWLFNYRVVSSLAYDFFNPYQDRELLAGANNMQLPPIQIAQAVRENTIVYPYSEKSNSIEIPKINITAPVIIGQSTDPALLVKDLDNGTVLYPGSVLPSQKGQTIILGHSAPPGWPKIKYDWVFSNINDLNFGEEITLHFNNKKYTYKVMKKDIVKPGEEIPLSGLEGDNNILVLVSCWPPGKNYLRIAVQAQLIPAAELAYK